MDAELIVPTRNTFVRVCHTATESENTVTRARGVVSLEVRWKKGLYFQWTRRNRIWSFSSRHDMMLAVPSMVHLDASDARRIERR